MLEFVLKEPRPSILRIHEHTLKNLNFSVKGLVHFQIKISWSFTHPHVIQDVYVFLSSVEKKLRFLMKTLQESSSYSAGQTVEGQNYSLSAASKGYIRYLTMNKGLI